MPMVYPDNAILTQYPYYHHTISIQPKPCHPRYALSPKGGAMGQESSSVSQEKGFFKKADF